MKNYTWKTAAVASFLAVAIITLGIQSKTYGAIATTTTTTSSYSDDSYTEYNGAVLNYEAYQNLMAGGACRAAVAKGALKVGKWLAEAVVAGVVSWGLDKLFGKFAYCNDNSCVTNAIQNLPGDPDLFLTGSSAVFMDN